MQINTLPRLLEGEVSQPLIDSFEKLTDSRKKRGLRYQLEPLVCLLFLSKLGGADSTAEIADWVSFRFAELRELLKLSWPRSPHEVTWKRFLEKGLKAVNVEEVCGEFLSSLGEEGRALLNLDGKVVRGTRNESTERPLHLLALQNSEGNLTVEQTALEVGENEISAAKRLLRRAPLAQKIVSGDAIFAQTELSEIVVEQGGEYLWKLRGNQGEILKKVQTHFEGAGDHYEERAKICDKGHGRIEERTIRTSFRAVATIEFPYLEQVFEIKRTSFEVTTGKRTEQTLYGLTSLPVEECGAAQLLGLTRKHWSIENGLHYRRDVTFKEDRVKKKVEECGTDHGGDQ